MRVSTGVVVGLVCGLIGAITQAAEPGQRTLSFEERVRAQAAIERVYYGHQLGTKKPFDEAVRTAVLEAKVRKYLDQTAALNAYWKTAVTDQTLQRELVRMAQGTKMPERLLELYAALGNDPFLIKECLARPALVDRLTHNFYAFDPTLHAKAKAQADAIHSQLVSGALSASAEHPNRTVAEIVVGETDTNVAPTEQTFQRKLTAEEFKTRRAELPPRPGVVSKVSETRDAFACNVVLSETASSVRVASYVVAKTPWDAWWATARRTVRGDAVVAVGSGTLDLPIPVPGRRASPTTTCADDLWDNGTLGALPLSRSWHSAVWTGNVMVIWGGADEYVSDHYHGLDSGSRYDPATDTFAETSTVGAPSPRALHTAIWTGSRMIVWGGIDNLNHYPLSGGRYDPVADTWAATSTANAPSGRYHHTAIWSGSAMVVWGGEPGLSGPAARTGGKYDPASDSWTATSTAGAPSARSFHTAVWTGSEMVVWGGSGPSGYPTDGARYNPVTDSWIPTSTTGAPFGRVYHTAVWTGHVMVIWGGFRSGKTGGRYDPTTDTWEPTSTVGAPPTGSDSGGHSAIWTGSAMVVWGMYDPNGSLNTGGRYDPVADTWLATSVVGAPSGRNFHTAVWTGSQMIVWGAGTNTGGRYDPINDAWTPTTTAGAPAAPRFEYGAVWTGTLMIIWGGDLSPGPYASSDTGGRYDPVIDSWTATSTTGAPVRRIRHTAVWTGSALVVWGGLSYDPDLGLLNTGGRYDPIADSWTPTSVAGAPTRRESATAVWTATTMIVWGGYSWLDDPSDLNTGGRYDPSTDTWLPTSLLGAPSRRAGHTAVWTGSEMVIWGGRGSSPWEPQPNTGGRYEPVSDAWTAITFQGTIAVRTGHTAVWTGHEMLVWGGQVSGSPESQTTGIRYYPATDTWAPTSTLRAPSPRQAHSAIWTGSEMIVWGGFDDTGGRYSPATDSWTSTSTVGAPSRRRGHTAVWTGDMMLVWAGGIGSGGRYLPGTLVNDDCDGDGFTELAGDCNDHNAAVYPGAPQICDGLNNDCFSSDWPAVPYNEADIDRDGVSACDGDCNDNDAATYPGAPQYCDGINNDCNDSGWPTPPAVERDNDRDGYRLCDGDCDDQNRFVYPGRTESCDGIDNNCDGLVDEGGGALCNDNNPCTDDVCAGPARCSRTPNQSPCTDGNACTVGDVCGGGSCHSGIVTNCDDTNPCTDDSCEPSTGCAHTDNTAACDDTNACTTGDVCGGGGCHGDGAVLCDDNIACNGAESCEPAVGCIPGTPLVCNDNNICTTDTCNPATGCVFSNNANPCDDTNACTTGDTCGGGTCRGGAPLACSDGNACTTDTCDPATGCAFTNNTDPCNDGNACTRTDVCSAGACVGGNSVSCGALDQCHDPGVCNPGTGTCSNPTKPNGTACDDASLCTSGETCQSGTCTPTFSGLNHPTPKSAGYYKKLCQQREHNPSHYQDDQLTDADAACVGQLTSTFAGMSTVNALCELINTDHRPPHGGRHHGGSGDGSNGKDCDKAEDELIATALNICRARVCEEQNLDSNCHGNSHTTVSQSFADADAILDDAARDKNTCKDARCELREINNGHALEMNSLALSRDSNKVRLTWSSPVLDDGSGAPSTYELWRRPMGSNDAFVKIGTTSGLTYLDATAGSAAWEYDITAVIPGD